MPKNFRISITKLVSLFCFIILATSININGKNIRKQDKFSDNFTYFYVFNLIADYDRFSENTEIEQDKLFYEDYFKREANLSEEQDQILKTISRNFISSFSLTRGKEKLKVIGSHKSELRQRLGVKDFNRFDAFVKKNIASHLKVNRSGDSLTIGGSQISLVGSGNDLSIHGTATTYAFSLNAQIVENCAVSATMTGPGVSLSGSDSDPTCGDHNPSVSFTTRTFVPNAEYCVNANHTRGPVMESSSACLTAPDPPRITSVTYERILTDDLDFDTNPNTGGGLRMFPDKKLPNETANRRKIRVRAKYFQATANIRIYFRNFDLDDPSSNSAPVDDETTTNAGDDNRGNVDGTAATKKGQFSYPQAPDPNPFDCQPSSYGVSCLTDANGEATVDFTVTKQPGDNFTVAASPDSDYLSNLILAADGINLKDGNNLNTPVTKITAPASNACSTTALVACRAEMLTVWRRLHIEVDSMGSVTGNSVEDGVVLDSVELRRNQPVVLNVSTPVPLELNRFEDGRLIVNGTSLKVSCNISQSIDCNTSNTIRVVHTGQGTLTIPANSSFVLYDDDNMNDNDGTVLDGDISEDVPMPDICLIQGQNMPSWSNCTTQGNGDNAATNLFAVAYIRPIYDIGDNNNSVPFVLNAPLDNLDYFDFDQSDTADSPDFWTVYLIGAYQDDSIDDCDPYEPDGFGCTYASTALTPRLGSAIFMEVSRPKEYPTGYTTHFVSRATTSAHEIGHLFNGDHDDGWLMADPTQRDAGTFHPITLDKIRRTVYP